MRRKYGITNCFCLGILKNVGAERVSDYAKEALAEGLKNVKMKSL